ncbi:hypothetical protein NAV33_16545 [Pseudomonas stutzeri]|uniref:hypothetical protein n=1 Tax=Stutzerimonas stutzeri TaxID=316 RepID=UPI00210A555A|nr:hypothetical protein [Stutzerimonas stutzeri]MCQ4313485.1 hypothetical protein [Stutzerimonas stutzeri]
MSLTPDIEEVTIVIVGGFSPGLMSPHWFAFHELVSQQEAEEATVNLTTMEVSQIDFGWCKFYADLQRLQISTTQSPWIRISDLVSKLLADVLPGSSCVALGINTSLHFNVTSAQREKLGTSLAPREPWGGWGKDLFNVDHTAPSNGLISIAMRRSEGLENKYNQYVDVAIRGSNLLKPYGVNVHVNDHYAFGEEKEGGASIVEGLLAGEFERSISDARVVGVDIVGRSI